MLCIVYSIKYAWSCPWCASSSELSVWWFSRDFTLHKISFVHYKHMKLAIILLYAMWYALGTQVPSQFFVVGAGTLGRRVLRAYKEYTPLATLIAETRTPLHHAELASLAFPRCFDDMGRKEQLERSSHVLFALPPSAPNYLSCIESTLQHINNACHVILISSTGVYNKGNAVINENSKLSRSLRAEM